MNYNWLTTASFDGAYYKYKYISAKVKNITNLDGGDPK